MRINFPPLTAKKDSPQQPRSSKKCQTQFLPCTLAQQFHRHRNCGAYDIMWLQIGSILLHTCTHAHDISFSILHTVCLCVSVYLLSNRWSYEFSIISFIFNHPQNFVEWMRARALLIQMARNWVDRIMNGVRDVPVLEYQQPDGR